MKIKKKNYQKKVTYKVFHSSVHTHSHVCSLLHECSFKSLQLHEVDVAVSDMLSPTETNCDVACLLYDVTNPRSFDFCARMYMVGWPKCPGHTPINYISLYEFI